MRHQTNRRRFMAGALHGAAGLLVLPHARSALAFDANSRLNLAVFGNRYNAAHFLTAAHIHNAEIVAFCAPDQREVPKVLKAWNDQAQKLAASARAEDQKAAEQYRRLAQRQGVTIFADYRKMFGEMDKQIDALVVSDYEHFHGPLCGTALRLGKPVCNERPIGLNIDEARKLRALAAEKKVVTTYRSPGTGGNAFRRAMELVGDGAIGAVKEAHVWFKRGGPDRDQLPRGPQPIPEGLDWDLWLAGLPSRDYHSDWMAYSNWRETSCGGLGVFGPHASIFPFMTLKLRELWNGATGTSNIRVSAECARKNLLSFPKWERVQWEIRARGAMSPLTLTWHHGPDFAPGTRERIHGLLRSLGITNAKEADALMGTAGSLLVGADGALLADDHSTRVTALPKEKFEKLLAQLLQRTGTTRGIYLDWTQAIRGQQAHIIANFDNGGPLSELLMLGNIATQYPGSALAYDPASGRVTNNDEANQKLAYRYRDGWML